jgi:TolA-binding protein
VILFGGGGYYAWVSNTNAKASGMLADAMAISEARVAPLTLPTEPGKPAPPPPAGTYSTERAKLEAALPKFKAAADTYPGTTSGLAARYLEAGTLVLLGRVADGIAAYQDVTARAGDGLYGQMAQLGSAEAQVLAGQYDAAIVTYQQMAQRKDGSLPVDGILMQLGRAYLAAGKTTEAVQAFTRVSDEFPESPYASEAKKQLATLKLPRNG